MKIKKLEVINFRGFKGEHTIELSTDEKKSLTLIIAENGTGKTGFLEAIMWCLHGVLPEGSDETDEIICKYAVKDNGRAKAEVRLTIVDDMSWRNKKNPEYLITRILSKKGEDTEPMAWVRDITKKGGLTVVPNAKQLIEKLLPERLSPYFLFRGEGLKEWFKDEDDANLRRSIEDMQGLSFARQAIEDLKEFSMDLNKKLIKEGKATQDEKIAVSKLDKEQKKKDTFNENQKVIVSDLKITEKKLKDIYILINQSDHELIAEKNTQNKQLERDLLHHGSNKDKLIREKNSILHEHAFIALTFDMKDELSSFFNESKRKRIIPAPFDKITLQNVLDDGLCICGRQVSAHSPEEQQIKEHFDIAGSELQTTNKALIENLLLQYSFRNKEIRITYSKTQEEINQVENLIQEKENSRAVNIEDIKKASKDKDIEKLIAEQANLEEKKGNLHISQAQNKYTLNQINQEIKKQSDIIKRTSGGNVDPEVEKKKEFIDSCVDKLTLELQRLTVSGRDELGKKLQEICQEYNRKAETFEFIREGSYIPKIVDDDGFILPQNDGTNVQTAIYYALGLINVCVERSKLSDGIVQPGTIAPMVCDAVFSALDPINTGSVSKMLATIPKQTILLINSGSYAGPCRDELIKSNKIGKAYYFQRKQKKVAKGLSSMTVNGKAYKAFVKSSETSGTIKELINY